MRQYRALTIALLAFALTGVHSHGPGGHAVADEHPLDPAYNVALPCEELATPGLVPRSALNIVHVANVCGFVGTDVEFQSRQMADGSVRDYAFVGTMGAGLRIFDITDPFHPSSAGGYLDSGWQGDVQVRGDVAAIGFDPIGSTAPTVSACLQAKALETGQRTSGGVDVLRLRFDSVAGTFTTSLLGCVTGNPGGGAHNATIHPSGAWLAMSNPRGHGSVDVVEITGEPTLRYRIVQDASLGNTVCSGLPAPAVCISNGRGGTWSPHDLSFSQDGDLMYVAAVRNDTVVVDVKHALGGRVRTVAVAPNDWAGDGQIGPDDVTIAHQSDTTADGKLLLVTDERGGGLSNTDCNTDPQGIIGGLHVWSFGGPGTGDDGTGTGRGLKRLGAWYYPNPGLALDPLEPALAAIGRIERACTIHVLRAGGNGTAGPGEIAAGFGGVSSLPDRQLVTAHYGAGVWHIDISGLPTSADGTVEDDSTTFGNTLGWNVMPGAETWSAKEYKGFIYAGDMLRGFDVYTFGSCVDAGCVLLAGSLSSP